MTRRVIRDAVRIHGTDILDVQPSDEELAQLQHARYKRFDIARERRVAVGEHRIEVAHGADARGGWRDDDICVRENTDEPASELPRLLPVPGVEMHLPAAGLRGRKLDVMTESLEEPHYRDAGLRHKRVGQTGDKESHTHG